jgi:hypothetical protein
LRRARAAAGVGLLAGMAPGPVVRADEGIQSALGLEDHWIATDAYIRGDSSMTVELTRRVLTNVAASSRARHDAAAILAG